MSNKEFKVLLSDIPSSLLISISNVIKSYSTGLIKINSQTGMEENALLMGSGTFVEIDGLYGILTAHHVSDLLELGSSLGLILTSNEHRTVIDFQHLERITIGRGDNESDGPDLSFILLPTYHAAIIKPYKHFWFYRI